jgi:bifunctional non-homologous end joining protein LigD
MARSERANRVFVDTSQNDPGKQTIAPYSLRATQVPLVSAPLTW